MKRHPAPGFCLLILATCFAWPCASAGGAVAHRIPVVFHTDIGTDIDDTWALAYLLRCPELDLKLVLTDTGDTRYRAKVAAKLLEAAGRSDVTVGLGRPGTMGDAERNLAPWVRDYELARYPGRVVEDGIGALIETVMRSPEPVTIISVGAVPSLALALQREPALAARCRFVGMHGSFDIGYGDRPPAAAEANVKGDPAALRAVLAAPWRDVVLTPLDTCGSIEISGDAYRGIWSATDDPLLRAVIESYCLFAPRVTWMTCDFFAVRSTTLFDCVAVYLAFSEEGLRTEPLSFAITDDGFTKRSTAAEAVRARVALRWTDRAAFERGFVERLKKSIAR